MFEFLNIRLLCLWNLTWIDCPKFVISKYTWLYLCMQILHLAEAPPTLPGGMSEEGSRQLLNLHIAPASQSSQGASQASVTHHIMFSTRSLPLERNQCSQDCSGAPYFQPLVFCAFVFLLERFALHCVSFFSYKLSPAVLNLDSWSLGEGWAAVKYVF